VPAEVLIPELGESITDGVIVRWLKEDGAVVRADEPVLELETDKATVEIPATVAGRLQIVEQEGATVRVGAVVARIVEDTGSPAPPKTPTVKPAARRKATATATATPPAVVRRSEESAEPDGEGGKPAENKGGREVDVDKDAGDERLSAPVRKLIAEHQLDPSQIRGTGKDGRPTKDDVLRHVAASAAERVEAPPDEHEAPADEQAATPDEQEAPREMRAAPPDEPKVSPTAVPTRAAIPGDETDEVERKPMSRLRRRIAERLVEAQRTAAILTTFNEIDLSRLLAARQRHRERFRERHGVDLGLVSLFGRACLLALADVPILNARIDGDHIVYHRHVHLGIAVSTPHGLVVPVVPNADRLSLAGLERAIEELARLARAAKLTPKHLARGTFTITNGGVFGSLLSTPILTPPQSGILGMHKIEERPVAVEGQVVIRPMMYVALSYDHRLVDGEQAVTFLLRVKERLEDPVRMLFEV
jgi:2-oxoglutarate dehydrogenase E2 component (dihydrolipoamide succinyltransferase)